MTGNCNNCGAPLYEGQQFCRQCGASVRLESDEAPTQILNSGAQTGAAHDPTKTSTLPPGPGTDPSMRPPLTAPQAPFEGFKRTAPIAPVVPLRPRGGRWALPFLLGAALAGVGGLFLYTQSRRHQVIVRQPPGEMKKVIVQGPMPPMPPEAIEAIKQATGGAMDMVDSMSLAPLDEAGAVRRDDETSITKSYSLDADASFTVRNMNGNVTVEGWDKETLEVRVVKRGGSPEERDRARVMYGKTDDRLTLLSEGKRGGPVKVAYEIKLPRSLRQLEINSDEAEVKIAGMSGTVVADVKQGGLEFVDVTGTTRGKLIKGDTKVSYPGGPPTGTQEFSVVRGNVEIKLADAMSADVKAETLDGDIVTDDALGLKLVKTAAGKHLLGRLGSGADPLLVKVVNGDIKIKK
jgi:hypothetical protein